MGPGCQPQRDEKKKKKRRGEWAVFGPEGPRGRGAHEDFRPDDARFPFLFLFHGTDMRVPPVGETRRLTSGPPATIDRVNADVSIDQVNTDPINGQRSLGPTCQPAGLNDRWDPRVSAVKKKKKRKTRVVGPKAFMGSSSSWAFWAKLGPFSSPLFLFLLIPLQLTSRSHVSATPGSRAAPS